VVTGDVDTTVLDDLVRLCVDLHRLDHAAPSGTGPHGGGEPDPAATPPAASDPTAAPAPAAAPDPAAPLPEAAPDPVATPGTPAAAGTTRSRQALQQAIIGKAADLLSGPGGLASFLRTHLLDPRLAGPSHLLDVGVSRDIPAAIRHAVTIRAKGHCEWPGGCSQPAAGCEVHHLRHQENGGRTSVRDCGLYCSYHHQVVIHRMGWTVARNPDGTTIAISPDGTRVLRSHGPPTTRAG
jgi:hypothetical protein